MRTFIQLVQKGRTVIGMPQSLHYKNKELERSDAEDWNEHIREEVGVEVAGEKMVLTWRQKDSFNTSKSLYPSLDNRYSPR